MVTMGFRVSSVEKEGVKHAGDKKRGSRCKCYTISTIEPLFHHPASNGHQKVHNLKQPPSRQNAA
ncbi:uncharacterized protein N7482_000638 [Penicillium canariense]|uniref:Uncharacterized protein n=1 Tax=Penicillium canariense TaxID=189055 RepID=A0A9W9II87_9EURO|nr:uncharacterized protein N7482_000638 [Penicillium canariense]KAJ5174761.1 hypothetical protein N7482_000638 [Penicillium canariense]